PFASGASMGSGWSVSGTGATRTSSFGSGAAEPATKSVTATNGAGGTSSSNFTVSDDGAAPTTSIQCNGAACSTSYYTSAVSVTLTADDGTGSGVQAIRYTTDGSTPTLSNGTDYTGAFNVSSTATVQFRSYDNLGNEESTGSQDILFDGTPPTDSASHNVTATNGAGASSSASFTLTPDSSAPSGQSITLTGAGAPHYSGAVSFSLGDGSDSGSGLDTSTRTVTRESASLSGDSCGTFTADSGTFTSPDNTVTGSHCYRYSFTIADNVGNVSSAATA